MVNRSLSRDQRRKLSGLKRLSDAAWAAARARLAQRLAREREVEVRLRELDTARHALLQHESEPDGHGSHQFLVAARWMRWADLEKARLNTELARLRAESLEERAEASRAFGKDAALGALLRRQ